MISCWLLLVYIISEDLFLVIRRTPRLSLPDTLFPYTTRFRSPQARGALPPDPGRRWDRYDRRPRSRRGGGPPTPAHAGRDGTFALGGGPRGARSGEIGRAHV